MLVVECIRAIKISVNVLNVLFLNAYSLVLYAAYHLITEFLNTNGYWRAFFGVFDGVAQQVIENKVGVKLWNSKILMAFNAKVNYEAMSI